jgi:hypothetical protein
MRGCSRDSTFADGAGRSAFPGGGPIVQPRVSRPQVSHRRNKRVGSRPIVSSCPRSRQLNVGSLNDRRSSFHMDRIISSRTDAEVDWWHARVWSVWPGPTSSGRAPGCPSPARASACATRECPRPDSTTSPRRRTPAPTAKVSCLDFATIGRQRSVHKSTGARAAACSVHGLRRADHVLTGAHVMRYRFMGRDPAATS